MRLLLILPLVALATLGVVAGAPGPTTLRFEVSVGKGLLAVPTTGRVLVVLGTSPFPEPRTFLGRSGMDMPVMLGKDGDSLTDGSRVVVDASSLIFPLTDLARVPARDYYVQAVFDYNKDLRLPGAPENLTSTVKKFRIDPGAGGVIPIELTRKLPAETMPVDTADVKYLKFPSAKLSAFHGRPIFLRAGVILPPGHTTDTEQRYPLRVHIGGFGSRYTGVRGLAAQLRQLWKDPKQPRMLVVHLDGAGPLGDPYQVNSANHGPYGDAITEELIPHIEQRFRGIGAGWARVLDGASTGGWVSLGLQVFYPDFFNGAWSHCPDPVDFRSFELIDIYSDDNAYVNQHGFERPSERNLKGETVISVRHEVQRERLLGRGDRWTLSGLDWGSWNATFGPRGKDGLPTSLWDGATGKIDRTLALQWKKYDLRHVLQSNKDVLAPKLHGKLRIWVGEADEYFLNNAVHRLDDFFKTARPPFGSKITFAPREGHNWRGLSSAEMLTQMGEAIEKARPAK